CQVIDGVRVLWLCDDQANWGRFSELETILVEHAIPFDLKADGKAEFNPGLIVFRPGAGPLQIATNTQGEPVVTADSLAPVQMALVAAITAGEHGDLSQCLKHIKIAHAALEAALPPAMPPLPVFEIG